jgi:hypothetical protein
MSELEIALRFMACVIGIAAAAALAVFAWALLRGRR